MDCQESCVCNTAHTEKFDPICGQCLCLGGWTGTTCESDIDECLMGDNDCDSVMENCGNTLGSFTCHCKSGYACDANYGCQGWYFVFI